MLSTEAIEAFKEAGYSFEEIQRINESIKDFEETWICYDADEVFTMLEDEIFSKYKVYA